MVLRVCLIFWLYCLMVYFLSLHFWLLLLLQLLHAWRWRCLDKFSFLYNSVFILLDAIHWETMIDDILSHIQPLDREVNQCIDFRADIIPAHAIPVTIARWCLLMLFEPFQMDDQHGGRLMDDHLFGWLFVFLAELAVHGVMFVHLLFHLKLIKAIIQIYNLFFCRSTACFVFAVYLFKQRLICCWRLLGFLFF